MRIKKISIKNIRSYTREDIEFPEGSLLLSGDIGTGKTSILLAIEYALFGLQPGQKGSSLLRNDADLGEVSLELEISGHNIVIERQLKRHSKAIANEYSAITIDGEKLESSTTELKTKILSLINYPSEFIKKTNLLYKYTVYTPQEQMKQIIIEDPEIRLNVIRHIFGIDKYRRMSENLDITINKLKEESKILQGEIKTLDQDKVQLEIIKNSIEMLRKLVLSREDALQKAVQTRKLLESESLELEKRRKERESILQEIEKAKILLGSKKDNFITINREILELQKNISETKETFEEAKLLAILQELEIKKSKISQLNSQFIEIMSSLNSLVQLRAETLLKKDRIFQIRICPTCLQDVPEFHKHNILNDTERQIVNLKERITGLEEKKSGIERVLDLEKLEEDRLYKAKAALEILQSKTEFIEKSKKKLEATEKQKEALEKDISLLSSHLEGLKEESLKMSKFDSLFKHKQDELKDAFRAEKNAEILLAESKKELEMTIKESSRLAETILQKENSKKKLSYYLDLTDWLSNKFHNLIDFTERSVMIKLRKEFSKLFEKWFSMLVPEGSFEVRLDEKFTPIIMQGETEMDYSFLSGGERTAVALAYRLALNQTINLILSQIKTSDLVILDEPTEGFSETQLDKMRDVFSELNIGQLIIVSHEQKIESFVDNVIRLKKAGNISYLETAEASEQAQTNKP